ncbi:hypothetical protein C3488_29010 [Streptomyces sp. Ru72]|nr:hypothetical protein C3488_29010 [Streptomyces sp. Ru72]
MTDVRVPVDALVVASVLSALAITPRVLARRPRDTAGAAGRSITPAVALALGTGLIYVNPSPRRAPCVEEPAEEIMRGLLGRIRATAGGTGTGAGVPRPCLSLRSYHSLGSSSTMHGQVVFFGTSPRRRRRDVVGLRRLPGAAAN